MTINHNNKKHKVFKVKTDFGTYNVILTEEQYRNPATLAIILWSVEDGQVEEQFTTLTVNLDCYTGAKTQGDTRAYVDINNNPWATAFLEEHGLGNPTGHMERSGYCLYPLYEFNLSKIYED